jgi:glycosyltransferase involved in cell wall biosynthesis
MIMKALTVVSPYTHLSGHYWPYTVDMADAFSSAGREIKIFAALPPRVIKNHPALMWNACAPWITNFQSIERRNRNWGSKSDTFLRNLEFYCCLQKALREADKDPIFCIESRHHQLLKAVLQSNRRFSSLCVGAPDQSMPQKRVSLYREAFATGRLHFIVETEAVRQAWEPVAGESVIHIPAAITERSEQPLTKQAARRKLGLDEDGFMPLFFGTHREGKDYRTAIEAAKLAKEHPFLIFAGPLISGNDPNTLLKELGYNNAKSWNRYIPDDEVSLLFDACDVVMLPYSQGYTKGSAVLLQACKYGKPIIASNTGHLANFVNTHKVGLLYKPGDPESLASAYDIMCKSVKNIVSRWEITASKTMQSYSWGILVKRYLEIFNRV